MCAALGIQYTWIFFGMIALNARDVEALLSIGRCIALMRTAMTLEAENMAIQPVRTRMEMPGSASANLLTMMPGLIDRPLSLGIKVVSVFPGNYGTAHGSHQGAILMFDAVTGAPVGLVDARAVTALRTAAATAVATDVLARPDAASLSVLGYGDQAKSHVEALVHVRDFASIQVWGRDPARLSRFTDDLSRELERCVEPAASAREACEADVVTATTAAVDPVIEGEHLQAGQHLNLVGSSIPSTAEVDGIGVARARFFGDSADGVRELGGEYRRACRDGLIDESHLLGTVGEVMLGRIRGRTSAGDVTMFKSVGMAAEDLVASTFLLDAARRQGVGRTIDW